MKKLLSYILSTLIILCLSQSAGFAQQTQQQDDTRPFQVGAGLIYGSEVEELGFQVNINYPVLQNVELAPDISIYFADNEQGIDNYWELNINGHYFLAADDEYNVYGLAGLNITTVSPAFTDDSETEAGINVGIGTEYYLDFLSIYGELKYVLSDFDQLVLGAGARIPF